MYSWRHGRAHAINRASIETLLDNDNLSPRIEILDQNWIMNENRGQKARSQDAAYDLLGCLTMNVSVYTSPCGNRSCWIQVSI